MKGYVVVFFLCSTFNAAFQVLKKWGKIDMELCVTSSFSSTNRNGMEASFHVSPLIFTLFPMNLNPLIPMNLTPPSPSPFDNALELGQ